MLVGEKESLNWKKVGWLVTDLPLYDNTLNNLRLGPISCHSFNSD